MKLVCQIGEVEVIDSGKAVFWWSGMNVDNDGSGGNPEGDPCHQGETSLKHEDGTSLNAQLEKFGVVPPQVIRETAGVVMGCQGLLINTLNGLKSDFVVGDEGPSDKIGEGAVALAKAVGVPPSPINGGVDTPDILWIIYPGKPAVVDGRRYRLQPSGSA